MKQQNGNHFVALIAAGALMATTLATTGASAHISGPVTIDFQDIAAAVFGEANVALLSSGSCAGSTACYFEDDLLIGVVSDPNGDGEHVHRSGASSNRKLLYEPDSSGIYVRAEDGHEFGLFSLEFDAQISDLNPDQGPAELWEILGFNSAVNPDLATGNGTDYASRVAYQTVANGFNGLLTLDEDFHDINAFWIHYKGFPGVPTAIKDFRLVVDTISIRPAEPTVVPVPAVGVWMLMGGFAGLVALGRQSTRLSSVHA